MKRNRTRLGKIECLLLTFLGISILLITQVSALQITGYSWNLNDSSLNLSLVTDSYSVCKYSFVTGDAFASLNTRFYDQNGNLIIFPPAFGNNLSFPMNATLIDIGMICTNSSDGTAGLCARAYQEETLTVYGDLSNNLVNSLYGNLVSMQVNGLNGSYSLLMGCRDYSKIQSDATGYTYAQMNFTTGNFSYTFQINATNQSSQQNSTNQTSTNSTTNNTNQNSNTPTSTSTHHFSRHSSVSSVISDSYTVPTPLTQYTQTSNEVLTLNKKSNNVEGIKLTWIIFGSTSVILLIIILIILL